MPSPALTATDRDKLPDWAAGVVKRVEDFGFTRWTFHWDYPIPPLDKLGRVQIRDEKHSGQPTEINRYAEAMKRGEKFPPGVITSDPKIVDWNTRVRAAHKLGWPSMPVIVLAERWADADQNTQDKIHLLGASLNTGGPKPLTRTELTEAIILAARHPDQWTPVTIASRLHASQHTVASIFAQLRAEERAARLGVEFNGSVPASIKSRLGQRSEKFTDQVFREVARLVQQAGLKSEDVQELCKGVLDISSGDEERLNFIANERMAREEQIARFTGGGKRKPPLSTSARPRLKWFVDHQSEVTDLVDGNPNTREQYLRLAETTRDILNEVVAAQHASMEAV